MSQVGLRDAAALRWLDDEPHQPLQLCENANGGGGCAFYIRAYLYAPPPPFRYGEGDWESRRVTRTKAMRNRRAE
eukprot:8272253-Pyramimonas_sp.AAC.1